MRTYELMVVLDPRMTEDEATTLTNDIHKLVESSGAEVIKTDVWGRRKLAYEIQKLSEGRYILFYLSTENGDHTLRDAERRLQQNDNVLRYLTVRTDEDLRRAGLPLPTADEPIADEEGVEEGAEESSEATPDSGKDSGKDSGESAGDEEE